MSAQSIKIDDLLIGRFHIKIAGLTFGAHFTDGYILGLIGIAFTLLSPQMQLDAFWQGLIGASAVRVRQLCRGLPSRAEAVVLAAERGRPTRGTRCAGARAFRRRQDRS